MNHSIQQEIRSLESLIPSGFGGENWDFKAIWAQIKATQAAFNSVRLAKEDRAKAWDAFQNLVQKVKDKEAETKDIVLRELTSLETLIPSDFSGGEWDFKAIWAQIKATQAAFKGSRFPNVEERQKAWNKFQDLIGKVKQKQENNRKKSAALRDRIIRQANSIPLSDDRWVAAVLTGGLSVIFEAALDGLEEIVEGKKCPPYAHQREILKAANKKMKNVRDSFRKAKSKLLSQDKDAVYRALENKESQIDDKWAELNQVRAQISAKVRDEVVGMAGAAIPQTPFWEAFEAEIFAIFSNGVSLDLGARRSPLRISPLLPYRTTTAHALTESRAQCATACSRVEEHATLHAHRS